MNCIETNGLVHHYSGREPVLEGLNLQVPEGAIYGLLGANGAGKTTTLRLLLGLLPRQEGSISIFGKRLDEQRIAILKKTGALIETPSIYGHLTAKENLEVIRKVAQCPTARIETVLKTVGLEQVRHKKAGRFSLGMKQRLGIAIALINEPSLLILDEPTNGLDPNGIIEMRELLKKLNRERGMTILISSHLLTELERIVTHAGIIHKGRLLFQGSMQALQEKQAKMNAISFVTSNPEATLQVMQDQGYQPTLQADGEITIPMVPKETVGQINRQLHNCNISIYRVGIVTVDLESIFIELTQN